MVLRANNSQAVINLIRIVLAEALLLLCASGLLAQWVHSTTEDPFKGKAFDNFVLYGSFNKPPRVTEYKQPRFVISCTTKGDFGAAVLLAGAVLEPLSQNSVESRIFVFMSFDGGKPVQELGFVSEDLKYITFEYDERTFRKLIKAKKVRMVTYEYPNNYTIVMDFDIPDSTEVIDACHKFFKKDKK